MNNVLEKYSTRLIKVSKKNGSLVLRKLYKNKAFDLTDLDSYVPDVTSDVVKHLLDRNPEDLLIMCDPYSWYSENLESLKLAYKSYLKEEIEKLKSEERYNETEEKKVKKTLADMFNNEKEELEKTQEKMLSYSSTLASVNREAKKTLKETGRYELYVGYPFVEGYFKDKTFVKAPLLLFPVAIEKKGDRWFLKNQLDMPILLNRVFLLAYAIFNEGKECKIETEYDNLEQFGSNPIEKLLIELEALDVVISYSGTKSLKFVEYKKDTPINYVHGELVNKNYLILGRFNIANSIYNDYKELNDASLSNKLIDSLLKNDVNEERDYEIEDNCDTSRKKDVKEEEFFLISDLDYSQELAVKKTMDCDSLVIYGPPGTGKSQTIASVVSQQLSHDNKILVVSQKKAALDVIYNRTASINSKLIMFNSNISKKEFYSTLARTIEGLSFADPDIEKVNKISYKVQEKIHKLEAIEETLTKERDFGLSLQEMYANSNKKELENENIRNFFKEFRRNYPFKDFTLEKVRELSNDLIKGEKAEKYYKYSKYDNTNESLKFLKTNVDFYDMEDAKKDISKILVNYEAELAELEGSIDFFEEASMAVLEQRDLHKVAKELNKKINSSLLKDSNVENKLSLKYWVNYSKNSKIAKENRKLYDKYEIDIFETLKKNVEAINKHIQKFSFLGDVFVDSYCKKILSQFMYSNVIKKELTNMLEALDKYNDVISLKLSVERLSDSEKMILDYMYKYTADFLIAEEIISSLPNLATLYQISCIQSSEASSLSDIENFEILRNEINEELKNKKYAVADFINKKWDNRVSKAKYANESLWKEMERQCTKKTRLMPIRQFIYKFKDILFELYPCWLLSPEAVSEILPLTKELFDIVIFDEASQMYVEAAIPAIYRSKKIVVAGDDKQLRPSSDFESRYIDEDSIENEENAAALEEESLLDLAKFSFDSTSLYYHYRSKYDELINFSNYAFYRGKLQISPNIYKTSNCNDKPIERIKVDGKWIDRRNDVEANEVVRLVKRILLNNEDRQTLGIITFNINQKKLIEDLLEVECKNDPIFAQAYMAECDRVENNEDLSLFVKNIENVQGDERDIIVFSTAYAENEEGKVVQQFGPLSQSGGENRLNVAISRAKSKIYLVTSIEPEQLNTDNSINNGPKLFKKYLQYVREVSNGNYDLAREILYSVCDNNVSLKSNEEFDSDFENEIADALKAAGLLVDTQIGVSGYRIDLGIYDSASSKYVLGIECDGNAFHSSKSARERDIFRQRYLESRGWKIIRIWSKDWWNNPKKEIEKVLQILNK